MRCRGTNARGQPCQKPERLVDQITGYCDTHAPGGAEHMSEIARKGGEATAARYGAEGFDLDELTDVETLEDAKCALDEIRKAVLTRKITHGEANAASKAVAEWVKAESAVYTKRLIDELQTELAKKAKEIEELRTKLGNRTMRAV